MASQGPLNGSIFVSDSSIGIIPWISPSLAQTSNDLRATAGLADANISEYLSVTGFSFSIPLDATIDGIAVEVERSKQSIGGGTIADHSVKIIKGGVISGTDHSVGTAWPITTDAYRRYPLSGNADLWGLTWIPADINASNFGFVIAAIDSGSVPQSSARVDHMRVTVFYTPFQGLYPFWEFSP